MYGGSEGFDRSAVSAVQAVAGSNGGAVHWSTIGRPLSARPFYSLLPQLMGDGDGGQQQKMGRCAGGLIGRISWGIAALPVPKHALMCLSPLPIEAWYPPKSAVSEWLATMI